MQRKLNLHSLALADLGNWEMVNCGVTGPEKKKLIWVHGRTTQTKIFHEYGWCGICT